MVSLVNVTTHAIFTRPGIGMAVVWFGPLVILWRRFITVEVEKWSLLKLTRKVKKPSEK